MKSVAVDPVPDVRPSPSAGRAWIEMLYISHFLLVDIESPSAGRAWIEILLKEVSEMKNAVALRGEGVD